MSIGLLAVLLALLVLAQGSLFRRCALKRLTYQRDFSARAVFAGDTVELVEVIRNRKLLPLPWLRVESRMSNALVFGGTQTDADEASTVSGNPGFAYHQSAFTMGAYTQVTRRHKVTAAKRGVYAARTVSLTCGDLFGTAAAQCQMDVGAELIVYPRPLDEKALQLPSSRFQGELAVRRWIAPDPFVVNGIRPYQPGDQRRDVHWAATARTGSLQVKAHGHTADPNLLVVLNVQLHDSQWANLMEYEQAGIETAISYAAALCLHALHAGIRTGFAANAPIVEQGGPTVLMPRGGAGRDRELLEALARLRIIRVRAIHTFLDDFSGATGLDIVVLSAYTNRLLEERVKALRRAGNSVTVYWPGGEAGT